MERQRARRFGVKAGACAVTGMAACLVFANRASADASTSISPAAVESAPLSAIELPATRDSPGVAIFPARGPGAHPITVLLHGMCGDAARACGHFANEVTRTSNLICPRANQRCAAGGASWPEQGVAAFVESAVTRAKATLGEGVDDSHGRTLIGYSLGAYRALELAQHGAGKYPRVMLIGARIVANQKLLQENGVERMLLSAGAWDMMHDPMRRETERLVRRGFTTRFLGLGPVGHAFTPSLQEYLSEALRWLKQPGVSNG